MSTGGNGGRFTGRQSRSGQRIKRLIPPGHAIVRLLPDTTVFKIETSPGYTRAYTDQQIVGLQLASAAVRAVGPPIEEVVRHTRKTSRPMNTFQTVTIAGRVRLVQALAIPSTAGVDFCVKPVFTTDQACNISVVHRSGVVVYENDNALKAAGKNIGVDMTGHSLKEFHPNGHWQEIMIGLKRTLDTRQDSTHFVDFIYGGLRFPMKLKFSFKDKYHVWSFVQIDANVSTKNKQEQFTG